ncbi:MAG: peptide chain release factor N(5)-glutamine methyltransferase, partial [Bacteroidota bacterium]
ELSPSLGPGEAASVTRLVLEDLFGYRRNSLNRQLSQDEQLLAWATINRLKAGEPVQYVTGIADFYGLQLHITPDVLIPRPETEELVEWVLETYPNDTEIRLLDVGTGSGCIPLALKARRPGWSCAAVDISPEALAVASENAERLGLEVTFSKIDALQGAAALPAQDGGSYNLIISNPPYIPPSEKDKMSASTVVHEPELALFVKEEDPLAFYQKIGELAINQLTQSGRLFFETNEFNHQEVVHLLESMGFQQVTSQKDLQGKWRMISAVKG